MILFCHLFRIHLVHARANYRIRLAEMASMFLEPGRPTIHVARVERSSHFDTSCLMKLHKVINNGENMETRV